MNTLLDKIKETLDPDELIDILDIDIDKLCDLCYPEIEANQDRFYFLRNEDD